MFTNLKEQLLPKDAKDKALTPAKEQPAKKPLRKRMSQAGRMEKYIEGIAVATEQSEKQGGKELAGCLRAAGPVISGFMRVMAVLVPIYVSLYTRLYKLYEKLPKNAMTMVFGAALCFFGGTFVASIAAIEAARTMGLQRLYGDMMVVLEQAKLIGAANEEDDLKDEDGDGVADVDQIPPHELLQRKTVVAMQAVEQPALLQASVGNLWAAYIAVLATLKLQFARTTALAVGIVEMVKFPIMRVTAPPLALALGDELKHWTETLIDCTMYLFAIIFAWYLQMIIAAVSSGLRGGRIFADALVALAVEHDWMDKLPDWVAAKPYDPDKSFLDEVVMYGVAVAGIAFQIFLGFQLPFPVNLVLWPLQVVEWILRIQISWN